MTTSNAEDTPEARAAAAIARAEALRHGGSVATTPFLPMPKDPPPDSAADASVPTTPLAENPAPAAAEVPFEARDPEVVRADVVDAIRTVFDPEIPVNVYDLGLVYAVEIDENGRAAITMTLTSPSCPAAGTLPGEVERKAAAVPGISAAWVDIVWEPPWGPDKMTEEAKLQLGFF